MADLQDQTLGLRQLDQFIGFLQGAADGFFEKDVDAVEEEIPCDGMVQRSRNGNADRLNAAEQVRMVEERTGVDSLCDLSGPGGIDVHHPDQLHPFDSGIFLCVELAQITDADHTDLDGFHLTTDPPFRMLDELEEVTDFLQLRDGVLFDTF